MLEYVLMIVPVVFLVGSVCYAYKTVVKGRSRKRAVVTQIASFCVVGFACLLTSLSVFAAGDDSAAATAGDMNMGLAMIAAALATGAAPFPVPSSTVTSYATPFTVLV